MKTHFLPTTLRGRIGTILAVLALLEFLMAYVFAQLFNGSRSQLLITVFDLTAMIAALTGAVMAILAVRKDRERSVLAFFSIFLGISTAVFLLISLYQVN